MIQSIEDMERMLAACLAARDVAETQLHDAGTHIASLEAEIVKLKTRYRFLEDQFLHCAMQMASTYQPAIGPQYIVKN